MHQVSLEVTLVVNDNYMFMTLGGARQSQVSAIDLSSVLCAEIYCLQFWLRENEPEEEWP